MTDIRERPHYWAPNSPAPESPHPIPRIPHKSGSRIPQANPGDDFYQRFNILWRRLLSTQFHLGRDTYTVEQFLTNPDIRQRVFHKIQKRLVKDAKMRYEAVKNHPKVVSAKQFREDHVTLRTISYEIKLVKSLAKVIFDPLVKAVKHGSILLKIVRKVTTDPRDFFQTDDLARIRHLTPKKLCLFALKITYNTLKLVENICDFVNTHPLCHYAYKSAHLGDFYQPFAYTIPIFIVLAPYITGMKLLTKSCNLYRSFQEWRLANPANLTECSRKRLALGKSSLSFGKTCFSLGVKILIGPNVGLFYILSISSIGIASASIGLWQHYSSK